MIGNDIVDLALARKESNWKRKGYLSKIFSDEEQLIILQSKNPENYVWILWSMKEASYKIFNRDTGIRGYFPLRLKILKVDFKNDFINGKVICGKEIYKTKTIVNQHYIYTVAVNDNSHFNNLIEIENKKIQKDEFGRPFYFNENARQNMPVSKTHHGRFQRIISILKA